MSFFKKAFKFSFILLIINILLLIFFIESVPKTHYSQTNYYANTLTNIEQLDFKTENDSTLEVGYNRQNLMFPEALHMAGYGFRGKFENIHDSLKINTLYLKNNSTQAIVISLDLLIFPPEVVKKLELLLPKIDLSINQVFFSATHTHTGTGGWAKPPLGWLFGGYDDRVTNFIATQIIKSIQQARQNCTSIQVGFQKIKAPNYLHNRLTKRGQVDDFLRVIEFKKDNGNSILWTTYAAHLTCIGSKYKSISRDYAGVLVDELEKNPNVEFALFSAGAVGSHAPKTPQKVRDFEKITVLGKGLAQKIKPKQFNFSNDKKLIIKNINIEVGQISPRISENWQVRSSIFKRFVDPQSLHISFLQIGNVILLGIPADFSGELVAQIEKVTLQKKINLLITCFNGGYVGYILPQERLQHSRDETREMNWLNDYTGAYFVEISQRIISKIQ